MVSLETVRKRAVGIWWRTMKFFASLAPLSIDPSLRANHVDMAGLLIAVKIVDTLYQRRFRPHHDHIDTVVE